MIHQRKALFVALAATLALSIAASSAAANRSLKIEGQTRGPPLGLAVGTLTFAASSGINVICAATLKGSLHGAISKTSGTLAGYISDATIPEAGCRTTEGGGAALRMLALPWHIIFQSFSGTLPSITAVLVKIIRLAMLVRVTVLGVRLGCLYAGNVGYQYEGARANMVERIRFLEESIALSGSLEGGELCSSTGRIMGSLALVPTGAMTLL